MKKTFLLIAVISSFACFAQTEPAKTKEQPKKDKTKYYVNINIDIVYKDKDGNDLLDVNSPKHYTDIVLFKMEKGEKIKIDKPHMDHPNNQFIFKDEVTRINHLRVFLECEEVLVQLDAQTTDTIKCKIKKEKGSTVIEKVWYNGKLEWERGRDKSQVITITK